MKKILSIVLILIMLLLMTACTPNAPKVEEPEDPFLVRSEDLPTSMQEDYTIFLLTTLSSLLSNTSQYSWENSHDTF